MTSARRIEPEYLDILAQDEPRAIRSRRDLRRINAWMLQPRIMARLLQTRAATPPRTILELGSGDGTFMLRVARRMAPAWSGGTILLLDRQDLVDDATLDAYGATGWSAQPRVGDVFELLRRPLGRPIDLVVANLFLHHFEPAQLAWILQRAARLAPQFVATEPRRGQVPLLAARMLWTIGCSRISRHDAAASTRAGFRGAELSALWPDREDWAVSEHPGGLFSHCFVACRQSRCQVS
jgi:hypothetical protein